MKLTSCDKRTAVSILRLAFLLSAVTLLPLLLFGSAPSWWSSRGVLAENAAAEDYAPINQGQLRNIARAAVAEMDAKLAGGAGGELHRLVSSWLTPSAATNDFAPVNLGQLKTVAKPFYDRLIAEGLVDFYPWLASLNPPDDFAVANIGQVKKLFSFELRLHPVDDPLQNRLAAGQRSGNLALEAAAVWYWGNRFGVVSSFQNTFPRRLTGLPGIRSVSTGDDHRVLLTETGAVLTWGKNNYGQLGDATNVDRETPVAVPNLANIVSVKAGAAYTLALQQDGTVLAWGENYYGQLGNGDNAASSSPVQVVELSSVRKIGAGPYRSVAVKEDGTVWTWGYDHYANGQDLFSNTPAPVADLTEVIEIAVGYEHVVAVKADGTVWAWGSNYSNQIGDGSPANSFIASPVQVPNLANVVKVASNYDHSLAVLSDGTVWAWGANNYGQLGDGTTARRQQPVRVTGLTDVVAVATNYQYSLAMKADGTVWTWGEGSSGTVSGADLRIPQQVGLGLFDANQNGLDDRWELEYFGNLDQTAYGDFDGDGVSNLQEVHRGTDPRDYFNGVPPVVEIAGGNNQVGGPGTFLSKPFKVRLRNAAGQLLVNAPVRFTISGGAGALSATYNGAQEQSLLMRTDANGEAAAYHALPNAPGFSTRTIAIADGSAAAASATFRGIVQFSVPPPPTPPPDPNNSPTPTPSPTATPLAPYRYAIIDLGKDLYPRRINNKGWILLSGEQNGQWGHFRWKGGVFERLTYASPDGEMSAEDMNDVGAVVGYFSRSSGWKPNAENELQSGLYWPPDSSNAIKISSPSALTSIDFRKPGTLREASLTAINNSNDLFGTACTSLINGWGFLNIHIVNSVMWPAGSAPPVQLSQASAVNPPNSNHSEWHGSSDTITRANSNRRYIGVKVVTSGSFLEILQTQSDMVDGQSVSFHPKDINEAGIVVGSAGADMVVSSPQVPQNTINGASPLAINDHTYPAPSPAVQSSPAPSPQPTPIPAPQILAWAGNGYAIWELQPDGKTWHPFGLEEMIPSMEGWEYIDLQDMNDTGAIVGRGWYTDPSIPGAQGENHAFLLLPVGLMVDRNRDGQMSFGDPIIWEADRTSPEKPYRFWLNNDHDEERAVDSNDREQDDYETGPDFDNPAVLCERDLEDWSRLWINFKGITGLIKVPGVIVELAWQPNDGGRVWSISDGSPGIKIMLHDSQAGATATDATYLLNTNAAGIQAHGVWGGVIRPLSSSVACVLPNDFLQFVSEEQPYLHLLFEGWTSGRGELVIRIKKDGQEIGVYPAVHLDLKDVKDMYERYSVGEITQANTSVLSSMDYGNWPVEHPTLLPGPSNKPFSAPAEETKNYILWVHGWNMSPFDKDSYGDTAFKRLFWQGYEGRFGTFRWPTFFFTSNIPPAHHFDASEHRAWASSLGLLALLNELNRGPFSGKIRMMAHSLGNVAASEALRRSNSGQVVHSYIASQAAISAHFYDVAAPAMQYDSGLGPTTPNVYGHYWRSTTGSQPHEWTAEGYLSYMHPEYLTGKVGRYLNYYNEDDWALTWPRWQLDQQTKPDADYGYEYGGSGTLRGFWRDRGFGATWLTFPADRHEIFAWAAESRSYALGAQWVAGVIGQNVDLKAAPFSYGQAHKFHSGQFRGSIMERRHYWEKLLIDSELKETQ